MCLFSDSNGNGPFQQYCVEHSCRLKSGVSPSDVVTDYYTYLDLQWGGFVVQSYSLSLCIGLSLRGGRGCRILGKEREKTSGGICSFIFRAQAASNASTEPRRHNQLGISGDGQSCYRAATGQKISPCSQPARRQHPLHFPRVPLL